MSRDFEVFIEEDDIRERQAKDAAIAEEIARAVSHDEDRDDIFNQVAGQDINLDLKAEIHAQIMLLKAIRSHIFYKDGEPKEGTDPSDITSYMSSALKLLSMLQSFESSLKTDSDVRRIEMALEMAMEDCPCPEFVTALTGYLEGDLI